MEKTELVKRAMLGVQRFPWEQGVCMQALYEDGELTTAAAMAHDAVTRQQADGRLAVIGSNIAVTDPAANGEVVYRTWLMTGDPFYRDGAQRMLDYLMQKAPRTDRGILCHNEISFEPGFSPDQIWADSVYMAPPFLAAMGQVQEAYTQICGMMDYLTDPETGLLFHIYDAGQSRFVRRKLWATGNGWALMGMGRVIDLAEGTIREALIAKSRTLLDALLKFQLPDGRFRDILDDPDSFADGASAMMMAAYIYRGCANGWLPACYLPNAERVARTMEAYVDAFGIIHSVCGCQQGFTTEGTSAESMAAYIMMHAWRRKCHDFI